jgi:hypothetical protein
LHINTHKTETLTALSQFRKRASEARVQNSHYAEQKTDIDFAHYRKVLKNQDVVAEAEKLFKSFKPVDYDVSAQLKTISAFESKAVSLFVSLLVSRWDGKVKGNEQVGGIFGMTAWASGWMDTRIVLSSRTHVC